MSTVQALAESLARAAAFANAHIGQLLLLGLAAFLLSAVLAPIGTLRWWAGRSASPSGQAGMAEGGEVSGRPRRRPADAGIDQYLVYLPGIDAYSQEWLSRRETRLLEIVSRVPRLRVVRDVFAYGMASRGLGEEPLIGRFWRWLHAQRISRRPAALLSNLINVRNVLQIGVSVDPRYGPIYNFGVAEMVREALLRAGYRVGSGKPITLLGYSGGGQLALGVVGYLKPSMTAAISVISVGGVLCDDPSMADVAQLVHLYGSRDLVQRLGVILFPGRWPFALGSGWHRAAAAGRVRTLCIGPMKHTGRGAYFDDRSRLPGGQSYLERTAEEIVRTLTAA